MKFCGQFLFRTQDGLNGIRGNRRVDNLERDQFSAATKYTQSFHRFELRNLNFQGTKYNLKRQEPFEILRKFKSKTFIARRAKIIVL